MKLSEPIVDKIVEGNTQMLWQHFVLLEGEYPEWQEDYNSIRFGYKVSFSIYDIWENKIIQKGSYILARDPYTNKKYRYHIEDYRTEIQKREKVMREKIYDNINIIATTIPR